MAATTQNGEPTPRELKTTCLLGAVFAPEGGTVSGFFARNRVQKDPTNLVPQSYYYKSSQSDVSQRLTGTTQGAGGIMPHANRYLGAPMATFAYGSIKPGGVSALPLVRAAVQSKANPAIYYSENVQSGNISGLVGDGSQAPVFTAASLFFPSPQYPLIPFVTRSPFSGATTVNNTYNLWRMENSDSAHAPASYREGIGPIWPTGYQGARYRTVLTPDGSFGVEVTAQNVQAQMIRHFPIADDLAYEGVSLYYPPSGDIQPPPRQILARGTENCGFQLHFQHSAITQMDNAASGTITGGLSISWGAPAGSDGGAKKFQNAISNFTLVLVPARKPDLYFYHPYKQKWERFELEGPTFGDGEYSIYVHYAGPNMYVGFDADPTDWNCFTPLAESADLNSLLIPRTPIDSLISIVFTNVVSTFQFGPAAFNNFHAENLRVASDAEKGHLGFVNVAFTVPTTKIKNCDPTTLNSEFQSHRFRNSDLDDPDLMKTGPSWYGDWRVSAPELHYEQISEAASGVNDTHFKGKVVFDTTIEGPQFLHIRNSTATTNIDRSNIVQTLPWGDVSEYFTSCVITVTLENKNRSRVHGHAEIVLENLVNTDVGAQTLTALEENRLAITVGAGFGETQTFFQGIVNNVNTERTLQGSKTTLLCEDIATAILTEAHFRANMSFPNTSYGGIINDSIQMSGIGDWFSVSTDSGLQQALAVKLGAHPIDPPLANNVLSAYTGTTICFDVLNPILQVLIDLNALPVFYWDFTNEQLNLRNRNELPVDELYFIGPLEPENIVFLPNSLTTREHGVLKGTWTTNSNVQQLKAGVSIFGRGALLSNVLSFERRFPESYSAAALDNLRNFVQEGALSTTEIGYTGWSNLKIIDDSHVAFPDQLALNRYGENLVANFLRRAYQSLNFECYVTEPLNHEGRFLIQAFLGGLGDDNPEAAVKTSTYYYRKVAYTINKVENFITASVQGEKIPSIILPQSP